MKNHFQLLKADIKRELDSLNNLKAELQQTLSVALGDQPLFMKVRTTGSILHDFYSGIEKIFQRVALEIDGEIPKGEDWHVDFLKRMSADIPQVRQAVITRKLADELEEYLRFRHLFRNIYGFELRWERCEALAKKVPDILQKFTSELEDFFRFLDTLGENVDNF